MLLHVHHTCALPLKPRPAKAGDVMPGGSYSSFSRAVRGLPQGLVAAVEAQQPEIRRPRQAAGQARHQGRLHPAQLHMRRPLPHLRQPQAAAAQWAAALMAAVQGPPAGCSRACRRPLRLRKQRRRLLLLHGRCAQWSAIVGDSHGCTCPLCSVPCCSPARGACQRWPARAVAVSGGQCAVLRYGGQRGLLWLLHAALQLA